MWTFHMFSVAIFCKTTNTTDCFTETHYSKWFNWHNSTRMATSDVTVERNQWILSAGLVWSVYVCVCLVRYRLIVRCSCMKTDFLTTVPRPYMYFDISYVWLFFLKKERTMPGNCNSTGHPAWAMGACAHCYSSIQADCLVTLNLSLMSDKWH